MRNKEFAFNGEVASSEESIVLVNPFYRGKQLRSCMKRESPPTASTADIPEPREVIDRMKEYWPKMSTSNTKDSLQAIDELIRCGFLVTQEEFERLSSQPESERAARRNKVLAVLAKFYLNAELPHLLESR